MKRFDVGYGFGTEIQVEESPEGEFVKYEDVKALIQELELFIQELQELQGD